MNDIYELNEIFIKFKTIDEFYKYFISTFISIQKKISIYDNILNLIIDSNKDNFPLTIFHLKEIEIKLNDIYYLLLNFINNNKFDLNQNKNEIQNNQKNEEKIKNDISEILNQNSKIQQDIISINQNIASLKNSIDSIQKNQVKKNQNIINDKTNNEIKALEDKISLLSKENQELKEELYKEKNKCNIYDKPKNEIEELNQPKIINENKIENIHEENMDNIITAKFNITDPNSKVRIMNSTDKNKNELTGKFDIYIDDTLIPFSWEHQFSSGGIHFVKYKFKKTDNNSINMSNMFSKCTFLKSIDFSKFDLTFVTNMSYIFYNCANFNKLIIGKTRTNNVLDTSHMFEYCSLLTVLDLSNFNTINVVNMAYMFSDCNNLKTLDLSNFNTSKVTDMSYMFKDCYKLESLNICNFNTSEVTNMCSMFYYCRNLNSLDLSHFDTDEVTNMSSMFYGCSKLISLDLSNFNTIMVTSLDNMFSSSINSIKVNGKDIDFMKKLKELNIKYIK